jgi:hypothetical protein
MTVLPSESPLTILRNNRDRIKWLREELKAELIRRNLNICNAVDDGFSQDVVAESSGVSRGQVTHILGAPLQDEDGQARLA